ncbi:serine/threonine-protein kinase [Mycobacterium sp. SMC-4]|uniref:serine/threonine-protein kinase n=1 Tax=Mycobacterium sp. SMC-4 TaxID=2857059 RepID=UPI003D088171
MTGHDILGGRYELRGILGRGGMAEVRDAFDTLLRRPVAVKMLHPSLDDTPEHRRRFHDEARAAAALEHPNIVAVHDFGEHDGSPFIVMERLPGTTLADEMRRGPMTPSQVRGMLNDVLAALNAAHRAGVLHRDIKPGNILVSSTGDCLKVGDFGIAKTPDTLTHTATGQIIGTVCYMSPERLAGAPASVADDLYAVGVIAYEALLGRRAFPQDHPAAVAHAILATPLPPLTASRPDVEPLLAGVIERAMARDPAQRFASADQMRAALAGHVPVPVPAPPRTRVMPTPVPPPVPAAGPPARSKTRPWVLVGGIAAAFLVAGIALAMQPFSSPPPAKPASTSTTVAPPSPVPLPPVVVPPPVVQPVETGPPAPPAGKPDKPDKPEKPDKPDKDNGRGQGKRD